MATSAQLKASKYLVLAEQLRAQIEQGTLKPGDRLPSFVEMRAEHNVTITTVERAYAHLEKDDLVVREQGRGTFVNQRAVRPVTKVIGIDGLTLSQHPFFLRLMEGFQGVASKAGFELLLLNNETEFNWEKVDGILSCDTGFVKREKWRLLPPDMPCVTTLVNARDFPSVVGDEYQGAYDLTQYLLSFGHERIAFMYDPYLSPRLAGYQNALRDAGIKADERWLRTVTYDQEPDRTYISSGCAVMKLWLEGGWAELGCTALITQNDDTALGVFRALKEGGWRVPEQVSIAGFDATDNGRYFQPQLTSVEVPLREMGVMAMEILLRQIAGEKIRPTTIVLPARILEGESVLRIQTQGE